MITPTIFDVKCVRTWVWIKMVRPCNPQIRWYGWFPMSYVFTHIQLTRVVCGPWCWMIFCSSSLGWFALISSKTHSRIAHINHPRNHGCRHHVFRDTDFTNHNLCFQILGHSWSSHVFPKLGFPLDLRILSSEFPGCQRDPRLWDEWRPVRRGKRGHHGGFMGSWNEDNCEDKTRRRRRRNIETYWNQQTGHLKVRGSFLLSSGVKTCLSYESLKVIASQPPSWAPVTVHPMALRPRTGREWPEHVDFGSSYGHLNREHMTHMTLWYFERC